MVPIKRPEYIKDEEFNFYKNLILKDLPNGNIEQTACLFWHKDDTGSFGSLDDGPLRDWIVNWPKFKNELIKRGWGFHKVLQAGGNLGMYARFYLNHFDKVVSIEPDPVNFYYLVNNTQSDRCTKLQMALGDTQKLVNLKRRNYANRGTFSINPRDIDLNHDIEVMQTTIDSLQLPDIDLIHLDVEGHEEAVIMGAQATIRLLKPAIITELGRGHELLKNLGYSFILSSNADYLFLHNDNV